MKKNILIFANTLNIGGIEKSLVSLVQSIDYDKYNVDLILKSGGILQKHLPKEVNILETPRFYRWIFLPKNNLVVAFINSINLNLNFIRIILYLIKGLFMKNMGKARQQLMEASMHTLPAFDGDYDVAIDYTGSHKSLIVNKVNAKKKISWIHSDYKVYRRDKKMDSNDYGKVNAIVAVSKTCYDIFVSEFPQYKEKTYIVSNITNKKQIHEMSLEKVYFDNNYSGVKVLDITRLDPNKGLDIAIKACKKLIEEGYDIKWYILGDGPERQNLEELIKRNDLEDRFILLGLQANPYPFIKMADLVVHCSLFEGKSVAIDEAMLLAKPIILTNYPTAKDQIENGINGLIADMSVEGVSNAIKSLINNKSLREELTMNLQDFELSAKESIEKLYNLLQN